MMPLRLNLLSPEKRKHLHNTVLFQFVKSVLEILLIIFCLSGIVLLGAQTVLEDYFNDLTNTIVFLQSKQTKTNREVREINAIVINIEKIQKEFQSVAKYLPLITNSIPNNITLHMLRLNFTGKNVTLSGEARTRDALLLLAEQIKKLECIQSVDMPISNLTKKEDVVFSLNASLK